MAVVVVAWITQHARTSLSRSLALTHAIVQTETQSTVHTHRVGLGGLSRIATPGILVRVPINKSNQII